MTMSTMEAGECQTTAGYGEKWIGRTEVGSEAYGTVTELERATVEHGECGEQIGEPKRAGHGTTGRKATGTGIRKRQRTGWDWMTGDGTTMVQDKDEARWKHWIMRWNEEDW